MEEITIGQDSIFENGMGVFDFIINLITIMCLKLNWILTTEMGLAILLVAFQ